MNFDFQFWDDSELLKRTLEEVKQNSIAKGFQTKNKKNKFNSKMRFQFNFRPIKITTIIYI